MFRLWLYGLVVGFYERPLLYTQCGLYLNGDLSLLLHHNHTRIFPPVRDGYFATVYVLLRLPAYPGILLHTCTGWSWCHRCHVQSNSLGRWGCDTHHQSSQHRTSRFQCYCRTPLALNRSQGTRTPTCGGGQGGMRRLESKEWRRIHIPVG